MTRKSRTGLLSAMTIWSLIVTPAALFVGGRGAVLGLVSVLTGLASLVMALMNPAGWAWVLSCVALLLPQSDGPERYRRAWVGPVARMSSIAVSSLLFSTGPLMYHEAPGRSMHVVVTEDDHVIDPATERDLGRRVDKSPPVAHLGREHEGWQGVLARHPSLSAPSELLAWC